MNMLLLILLPNSRKGEIALWVVSCATGRDPDPTGVKANSTVTHRPPHKIIRVTTRPEKWRREW